MRLRLAGMMFLQYFVLGATLPVLSLYLKDHLHFGGTEIGVVLGMSSLAALVSPIVGVFIADRLILAKHLLGLCHLLAAGLMMLLSRQTEFSGVVPIYLCYALALGPTMPLTNAIAFHHLGKGSRRFGNTRVFGTIGWVAVAWIFGYFWLRGGDPGSSSERLPDALIVSAISSLVMAVYALTLPKRTVPPKTPVSLFPMESLRVLFRPQVLLLALVSLLVGVVDRFYYFGAGPFLRHLGFQDTSIMPLMSIGQLVEIGAMGMLAVMLKKVRIKTVMMLGILAEIWRFGSFCMGDNLLFLISGIACHGIAYALFFTTVFMALDDHCDPHTRTSLHQFFAIITFGMGSVSAYLLAGSCFDFFVVKTTGAPSYTAFWLVPAGLSLFAFVLCGLTIRNAQSEKTSP